MTDSEDLVVLLKHEAIKGLTFRSAIPLLEETDGKAGLLGTGCLFEIDGRVFLISAAHVVGRLTDRKTAERVGIRARYEGGSVMTIVRGQVSAAMDDAIDVAVVELLDADLIETLRQGWVFLRLDNIAAYRRTHDCYYVVGYPSELSRKNEAAVVGQPIGMIVSAHEGPTLKKATPAPTGDDLLLEFPDEIYEGREALDRVPDPHGMSGSAVWAVMPESSTGSVWSPESQFGLAGIIVSGKHEKYLRARQWHLIYRVFEHVDAAIAEQIRERLEQERVRDT